MLIIQDMQNDVVMEGGAFAASGSPAHCRQQNAIENIRRLADACRARGVPVIHVWFLVEPGAPGVTMNAPLFEGLLETNAMVRGSWGSAPVAGLERKAGDHVVEKDRMSAWEGTRLETILKKPAPRCRDCHRRLDQYVDRAHRAHRRGQRLHDGGAGGTSCSTMNAEWHNASINYALQNVSAVTKTDEVIASLAYKLLQQLEVSDQCVPVGLVEFRADDARRDICCHLFWASNECPRLLLPSFRCVEAEDARRASFSADLRPTLAKSNLLARP